MKAIILAAGKGERLKPLTEQTPKAMILLHGKPLLEHVLISLKEAGVEEVIIVVGYLKQKIIDYFGNNFEGMKISFVEQKEQLGTAHALAQARGLLKEDFLFGFADTITETSLWRELMKTNGFDAVAVLRRAQNPERYGVAETKGKKIIRVKEKPSKPKTNLVLSGFYRFSPKVFAAIKKIKPSARNEFELPDAVRVLIQKGKVGFIEYERKIIDIGSLEDLKKAEEEKEL